MTSRYFLFVASLLSVVLAQTQQAQFNQVINLNGDVRNLWASAGRLSNRTVR